MRAFDLIPPDQRRGAGGAAGKSGGAAYVVLGALAVLAVIAVGWALSARTVDDRTAELATVQREVTEARDRAAALEGYTAFAKLSKDRTQTVRSIAASRFDWAHALGEVARVVPADVWLTGLRGTVTPETQVKGGSGSIAIRASLPDPALELTGCARSQIAVARMLASVRRVDGVKRVALQDAIKPDSDGEGGGGAGAGAGACPGGGDRKKPAFKAVVWFDTAAAARPGQGTPPAPAAGAPATATPAAPATATPVASR